MSEISMQYMLFLPDGYELSREEMWPLVLFLHGSGERGSDLELLKLHGIPKLIESGQLFPFIMAAPQVPDGEIWEPRVLASLLAELESEYRVDPDRVYVTGLSMGGTGTWDMALSYPSQFAAIAPICGRTRPELANRISRLPVWVFHGAQDPIVPVEESINMVRALRENGSNVQFTSYPEGGHDSWTETYLNPELYAWLLSQRRSK